MENSRQKTASPPVLRVRGLNVELGGERIIDDLTFEVRKGEILTILGPNGAGKTVLLKTLLGLLPYEGEILWRNKGKIGYLPQGLTQLKLQPLPLTVENFFKFKEASREKILKFLKMTGIEKKFLKKRMGDLSSGQFQRVLVAWTLIAEPEVLLFDEPTTGIDVGGEETIYSLIYGLWKKKNLTILFVTHEINIVYAYSTNVLCLRRKKLCYGPPKQALSPKSLQELYDTQIKFYTH